MMRIDAKLNFADAEAVDSRASLAPLTGAPLRILQVVPTYYPAVRYGGPIRSVHALSAALARRGHEVHVYTTNVDGPSNLAVPLDRPTLMDGVSVHYYRVPALRRLYWSPSMGDALRRTVANFDIVHTHSIYLWPTMAAANAAQRSGVPYLMSPRGMLMSEGIRRKNHRIKSAWIKLVEAPLLAHAAGIHVTADLEADDIRTLGFPTAEVLNIPNGVEFPDRRGSLREGPFAQVPQPYALFLSRISWKKGLDRLIDAWQWVPDLHLIVAGNDEEGYAPKLQERARALGLNDRIHFVGPVSDEHKWALYESAEMFILPSYTENFGNVVAEAMAMCCPVIVSDAVGIAAIVRTTEAGIVTSGEPRTLAEEVRKLHANLEQRRIMGRNGLQAVKHKLSWNAVAERMELAYVRAAHGSLHSSVRRA